MLSMPLIHLLKMLLLARKVLASVAAQLLLMPTATESFILSVVRLHLRTNQLMKLPELLRQALLTMMLNRLILRQNVSFVLLPLQMSNSNWMRREMKRLLSIPTQCQLRLFVLTLPHLLESPLPCLWCSSLLSSQLFSYG